MKKLPVPSAPHHALEVTIVSPDEIVVRHVKEGHSYSFAISADLRGHRLLSQPDITAGNVAHDPLAYRHIAVQRAQQAALNAQMIDGDHEVVALTGRHKLPQLP